jgi:hypothetical protein
MDGVIQEAKEAGKGGFKLLFDWGLPIIGFVGGVFGGGKMLGTPVFHVLSQFDANAMKKAFGTDQTALQNINRVNWAITMAIFVGVGYSINKFVDGWIGKTIAWFFYGSAVRLIEPLASGAWW